MRSCGKSAAVNCDLLLTSDIVIAAKKTFALVEVLASKIR